MRASLLTLLTCLSFCSTAQVTRVADIHPGPGGSVPSLTTIFRDSLVFFGDNGTNGTELLAYDGITSPSLVYDINPIVPSGFTGSPLGTMPELFGKLYFVADNGVFGNELWRWDGISNPSMVNDLVSGAPGSNPHDLVMFNNRIFFGAVTPIAGNELWAYEPLSNTTTPIADMNPGAADANPEFLTPFQSKLYFVATDPAYGTELFVYDPNTSGISLVSDIEPGTASSFPANLAIVGNKIYFSASTVGYGRELYSFDGNSVTRVTDINPGIYPSMLAMPPGNIMIGGLNGIVYFTAQSSLSGGHQLYRYVPGTGNVALAHTFYPGNNSMTSAFCVYNKRLFFKATTAAQGSELWAYDGFSAPVMIADLNAGTNDSEPMNLVVWDSVLYFSASDGLTGTELYKFKDSVTSVQGLDLLTAVDIFPNPSNGSFTVKFNSVEDGAWDVNVINLMGQLVYTSGAIQQSQHQIHLDVGLPAGMYMVRISKDDRIGKIPINILK